jgi:KRAB domain-containing zinc finger protein
MNTHVAFVHDGNKPFKCEACDYRSSQKGDLNKHVTLVHEGKQPFKCEICGYRCSGKGDLNGSAFSFRSNQFFAKPSLH